MSTELSFGDLPMKAGTILSLRDADGLRVRSRRGRLWITTAGSTFDTWIGDGEAATVSGSGLTVIEAATDAVVRLAAVRPAPEASGAAEAGGRASPTPEQFGRIVRGIRLATGAS
jgi:hypothetical protein